MTREENARLPIARTEGLIVEQVGAETVVFDEDSAEAHSLSPLASAVFAGSDGRTSVTRLAEFASDRLGEPVDVDQVQDALVQLDELGLMASAPNVISRRAMLRKTAAGAAVGAAFATPLVTSVLTPAYAQIGSPGLQRCPQGGLRCVSQAVGDDFCACANACPEGSPGAGSSTSCTQHGYTPPYFDSCFCAKCPTLTDQNPGQVPAGFLQFCPPIAVNGQQNCVGDGPGDGGCNGTGSPIDGICVPNDGDSSETCLNP